MNASSAAILNLIYIYIYIYNSCEEYAQDLPGFIKQKAPLVES